VLIVQKTVYIKKYADNIAKKINQPSYVYILDICDSEDGLKLLELNPFSGADLSGLHYQAIINAVSDAAIKLYSGEYDER